MAVGLAAGGVPLQGDQLAIAAAIEVLEDRELSSLTPHQDAIIFWDDAGIKLSEYLEKPRSSLAKPTRNCVAKNIEVVPASKIQTQYMPKELLGGELRELRMVINCRDSGPFYSSVTYRNNILAGLQFVVEPS
jgi:hypothetical protein